ncbi:hypothetical protein ACVJMZ_000184 [Sinorhizobium medicae]
MVLEEKNEHPLKFQITSVEIWLRDSLSIRINNLAVPAPAHAGGLDWRQPRHLPLSSLRELLVQFVHLQPEHLDGRCCFVSVVESS